MLQYKNACFTDEIYEVIDLKGPISTMRTINDGFIRDWAIH
ncbi:hypothetical protein [Emticicia fontis]